ncbi:MAG: cell wall-active antibiotics response protein [Lachnospiraceae bacterium]|nr:cell wall-active antibiotics response protein [Lachnospiraceae bacterium]
MNRNGKASGNAGNLMGILLIVAGIVIAGNVMNWWSISLFFKGWWTLFIIVPCAGNVRRYGLRTGWGAGLILGIMLLLSQWHLFRFDWAVKLLLPLLLILYGLYVIGNGVHFNRVAPDGTRNGNRRGGSYNAFFSGNETSLPGEEFFGANTTAVFGGVDLDLRGSIIVEDVTITATAVFGGIEIYLPDDVNVKLTSTALFGASENSVKRAEVPEWPTVYIKATAIFGGVEIF